MPDNEDRSVATLWRVIAESTREDNQRDVRLAEIGRDVQQALRDIESLEVDVRDIRQRMEANLEEQRRLARDLRDSEHRRLTDAQMRAIQRLVEMMDKRGDLDLLTEPEMEMLRSSLRGVEQWRAEHHKILNDLAENERRWEAHRAYLDQRLTAIQENREKLSDVESWKKAMEAEFNEQRQKFYEIELSRLSKDELDRMRTFLRQWASSDPNFEHFVALLNEYVRSRTDKRNWHFWLRQQTLVWFMSALIISPITLIIVLIVQHVARGG